jgi:hypothetical protein
MMGAVTLAPAHAATAVGAIDGEKAQIVASPGTLTSVTGSPVVTTLTASTLTIAPWIAYYLFPTWKCMKANNTSCTHADLGNPYYKQIVLLPTGYAESDRAQFWTDFDTFRNQMANSGTVWSTQKKDQILWVGYFAPGNPLGQGANFSAEIAPHPIRGYALALHLDDVYAKVDQIKSTDIAELNPMGTMVIFNAIPDQKVTANAAPPSFVSKKFGIAKMTRKDLDSGYIATHELGHAAMNFLDEYVEPGMENLNIRSFDIATPLALFNGTWSSAITAISDLFGVYDYNISEILAANGNVNIALQSVPSTVQSPISGKQTYAYEGGMFTGLGTFHMAGNNLMNGNNVMRGPDDGFGYAHSGSQQQVIDAAFAGTVERANDRIRNAGPKNGWPLVLGSSTHVMMYDGDKNNHFHPSQYYVVQVGWYEREWYTAWWGPIPYPDYKDVWKTAQNNAYPARHTIDLKASSLYGLANFAQGLLCGVGVTEIGGFKLCTQPLDTVATNFLPTFTFATPYEETYVPASQWMTKYWWRFATWNGTAYSYYTGWSSFYRSF